jgi:hypothetical protein
VGNYVARLLWPVGFIFASWTYGQYVIALEFALWIRESPASQDPLQWALYAGIFVLLLAFVYQALTRPRESWRLLIGLVSLGLSYWTFSQVVARLISFLPWWWISFVELDFVSRAAIAVVFAIGYVYVILGPYLFWKYPK